MWVRVRLGVIFSAEFFWDWNQLRQWPSQNS
jgi:hypothetical protein